MTLEPAGKQNKGLGLCFPNICKPKRDIAEQHKTKQQQKTKEKGNDLKFMYRPSNTIAGENPQLPTFSDSPCYTSNCYYQQINK